jgi:hypothetical protein
MGSGMKGYLTRFSYIFGVVIFFIVVQWYALPVIPEFGASAFAQQEKVKKKSKADKKKQKRLNKRINKRIVKKINATGIVQQISTLQKEIEQLEKKVSEMELVSGGPPGEPGLPGEKGDAGAKGETGAQGLPGDKGDAGAKGETGAQGLPGEKGDVGQQGLPGDKGDKGDAGQSGLSGAKGDKGLTGEKGDQGEIGPQGEQGPEGISGKDDVDGVQILFARKVVFTPQGQSVSVASVDINGTNLFISGTDPTIKLGNISLPVLYTGVIAATNNQQVIFKLPAGVIDGNHLIDLSNSEGDSQFGIALGVQASSQTSSTATLVAGSTGLTETSSSGNTSGPAGPESTGNAGGIVVSLGPQGDSGSIGPGTGSAINSTQVIAEFNTNVLLNSLRIAKSLNFSAFPVVDGKVDAFMDESGIDSAVFGDGSKASIADPGKLESTLGETLTLLSSVTLATKIPDSAHLVLLEQDIDSIELNSDLKGFISRDGGATWSEIVLSYAGQFDATTRILVGTHQFLDEPSASSMKYSITANSKKVVLKGVAMEWK